MKSRKQADKDTQGDYVWHVLNKQNAPPRSMSFGEFYKLVAASSFVKYTSAVGLFLLLGAAFLYFTRTIGGRYSDQNTPAAILICVFVVIMMLAVLFPMLRLRQGVIRGIQTYGEVTKVAEGQSGAYSTPSGMKYGSIYATISYTHNAQERSKKVFLDRVWVSRVKNGTKLRILVDPKSAALYFVIGLDTDER